MVEIRRRYCRETVLLGYDTVSLRYDAARYGAVAVAVQYYYATVRACTRSGMTSLTY